MTSQFHEHFIKPLIRTRNATELTPDGEAVKVVGNQLSAISKEDWVWLRTRLTDDRIHQKIFIWGIFWLRSGMPQVVVSHRLAASLMATSMERVGGDDICVPWHSFAIVLPPDLITMPAPSAVPPHKMYRASWTRVLVWCPSGIVHAVVVAEDPTGSSNAIHLWTLPSRPLERIGKEEHASHPGDSSEFGEPLGTEELRGFACIDRLILGVCAEMSSPHGQRLIASHTQRCMAFRRTHCEPTAWTYELKRDVNVDVREAVKAYVSGTGSRVTVQSCVRGHWKRQHHGPQGELVKWIQVEPYWRGPEDAPIALRNHQVGGAP